jgi:hypothetical protein
MVVESQMTKISDLSNPFSGDLSTKVQLMMDTPSLIAVPIGLFQLLINKDILITSTLFHWYHIQKLLDSTKMQKSLPIRV